MGLISGGQVSYNRFENMLDAANFVAPTPHLGVGQRLYASFGKRAIDVVAATLLLLAVTPIVLPLALFILITDGTPFFGHERVGQGGRVFKCWKFRTMRKDSSRALRFMLRTDSIAAQEWKKAQKLTFDPRITRVGEFLRKSSIDELPQLINVLRGEMSMVGPRPVTRKELHHYGTALSLYLAARPGLTGLWQVHGRGTTTYAERVEMDCAYVKKISLMTDIRLMLQTAGVVLKRTGS